MEYPVALYDIFNQSEECVPEKFIEDVVGGNYYSREELIRMKNIIEKFLEKNPSEE